MSLDPFFAEELVRKWAGHPSLFAEKDPASAPTLPGHGSTNPAEDMDMNVANDITRKRTQTSDFQGFERAFAQLESPISALLSLVTAQLVMLAYLFDQDMERTVTARESLGLIAIAERIEREAKALDALHLSLHNAGCRSERAA